MRLEGRAAELRHRAVELTESNRKLIELFQKRETGRLILDVDAGDDVREAVVAETGRAAVRGVVYLWDKPGGYGTGAQVAGQIRSGEKISISDETVVRGARWYNIYTTGGAAFRHGWVPSDAVAPIAKNERTDQ
jgi:hypothetical protein